jgi:hypothetical protein
MKGWGGLDQGGTTPLGRLADAPARAERALLLAFLPLRWSQCVFGGMAAWPSRRQMRRPGLAAAVWMGAAAWSGWLTGRSWRAQCYRETSVAWADVAASTVAMTAWTAATGDIEGHDWTVGLGLSAAGAAAMACDTRVEWLVAAAALSATHLVRQVALPRQPVPRTRRLVEAGFFFCFAALGASIAGRLRTSASEIVSVSEASIDRARVRGQLEERAKAASELHVGALEALKEVRSRWHEHDSDDLRNRARRETLRLHKALAQGDQTESASSLVAQLERVAEDYAAVGLSIELVTAEVEQEPASGTIRGLMDATRHALDHVVSEGPSARVVIRAATSETGALLTLRDSGGYLGGLAGQLGALAEMLAVAGSCARVHGESRLILEVPS